MARGIGAAVAALVLSAAAAHAGALARGGIAQGLLGRWDEARILLERDPAAPDRAQRYFLARALLETGRTGAALAELDRLAAEGRAFSAAALETAVHHRFRIRDHRGVARVDTGAVDGRMMDPDRFHYEVGQSRFLTGDPSGAQAELSRVQAGPLLAYALHSRALLAFRRGRLDEAARLLDDGIRAATGVPDPAVAGALADRLRVTLGRVIYQAAVGLADLGGSRREQLLSLAAGWFGRVRPDSPEYAAAVRGLGWAALELGDGARALGAFEVASGVDPSGRAEDLWAQGRVYQRLGFPAEAAVAYRGARDAALERVRGLGTGRAGVPPGPAVLRWSDRVRSARAWQARLEVVRARWNAVQAAADRWDERLATAAARVRDREAEARGRASELDAMAAGLREYLDRISIAALFPRAERARLGRVAGMNEGVLQDLAEARAVLRGVTAHARWGAATPAQRARVRELRDRVLDQERLLGRARLAFLASLKRRVSEREAELVDRIADVRRGVDGLGEGVARALVSVDGSRSRVRDLRERLGSLGERLDAAGRALDALVLDAGRGRDQAVRQARLAEASDLRLRADAYELDETQALHLLEQGATNPRGQRP